jgi:enoyl-CoA hydratase/carnithine racemase
MDPGLRVDTENGIVRLTLTRPEKRNSLTRALCAALHEALEAAAADPQCRAVVMQGSGGSFASGADLAELDRLRGERAQLVAAYRELRAIQELLYTLDRPTVAAIDGFCLGAGLSLALACDLRVATVRSTFAAPPARLGLLYSDPEISRLALRVGTARARDLLFTGRRIEAAEALQLGLIERMSAADGLEAMVGELAAQFAACSPSALREAKRQILRLELDGPSRIADDSRAEEAFFEADGVEGMAAFLERRKPRFPG